MIPQTLISHGTLWYLRIYFGHVSLFYINAFYLNLLAFQSKFSETYSDQKIYSYFRNINSLS